MKFALNLRDIKGPTVEKESLLSVLKDIDGEDKNASLYGLSDLGYLKKLDTESWIKSRTENGGK